MGMAVRRPALDHDPAELARRRLSLLGAELSPMTDAPSSSRPAWEHPGSHEQEQAPDMVPARRAVDGPAADARAVVGARSGRHARARVPLAGRFVGRALDSLPPTMHGRVGISAYHVTVAALLLAAAMLAATWMLLRAEPQPLPAHASLHLPAGPQRVTVRSPASSVAPVVIPGEGVPSAAATGEVVVHVAGRVRHPGVVELPAGSRVVDAIEAAGGARSGAHLGVLNLARLLVDGEQIAVGVRGAAAAPATLGGTTAAVVPGASGAPTALVNLNTASQAELEELPGVGPVTATSIIEWRTENGGFSTVDELVEVSGIGEVTLAELRDLVTV
jgi:competence protein ComEA